MATNGLEAAERLVACGGMWSNTELLLQLPGSTTHVQSGQLKGYWAGDNHAVLQPEKPTSSACAAVAGSAVLVCVAPEPGTRLLARCNGAFLFDEQARPLAFKLLTWCEPQKQMKG